MHNTPNNPAQNDSHREVEGRKGREREKEILLKIKKKKKKTVSVCTGV